MREPESDLKWANKKKWIEIDQKLARKIVHVVYDRPQDNLILT